MGLHNAIELVMARKIGLFFLLQCLSLYLVAFLGNDVRVEREGEWVNLLQRRGELRVVLEPGSVNYFLLEGRPAGFGYELMRDLCGELGLDLFVIPAMDSTEGMAWVREGVADIYFAPATCAESRDSVKTPRIRRHGDCLSLDITPARGAVERGTYPMHSLFVPDMARRMVFSPSRGGFAGPLLDWVNAYVESNRCKCHLVAYGVGGNFRSTYSSMEFDTPGGLSPYDNVLRELASQGGYDWRFLSSLIYQESRFRADVVSPRGAWGLLQFTPGTSDFFGISSRAEPREQIEAALRYLSLLDATFAKEGIAEDMRPYFVLAAYNSGLSTISRARARAKELGLAPNVCAGNVALVYGAGGALDVTLPSYHSTALSVAYGRGVTCRYVREVVGRYRDYCNLTI